MTTLQLETKGQAQSGVFPGVMITPSLSEDYWSYRVRLTDKQAIVAFPKFHTIGIGFAIENDDWNTNLPWTCDTKKIYDHIKDNKGDGEITDEDCLTAIRMIQDAIREAA